MNKKKVKKIIFGTCFCLILGCTVGMKINIGKSSAASVNYYNTYNDVLNIELDANYTSAQAMNICNNIVYYIKVANDGTANAGKCRMWAYDLKTKKNYTVYNGNTSNYTFNMGHANCMYAGTESMYIATQESGKESIYRYKIGKSGSKFYLYGKETFSVYSHNKNIKKPIAITGINYASELGGFLVKNGVDVYLGSFGKGTFNWTKHYTIDTKLSVYTNNGKENIDASSYIRQGMFYRGGKLYMPMTNNNKKNQSIIVAYNISKSTPNNALVTEDSNLFFRITSSKYSKLFEIEDVARHNGQMYLNVNATDSRGMMYDRIIKMKNYSF